MSLSTLLQNTQGTTTTAPTKSTVSTGGGLGKLVATAQANTNTPQNVQAPSIKENPAGTGYPALNMDGSPVTPPVQPTILGATKDALLNTPREAQTFNNFATVGVKTVKDAEVEAGTRIRNTIDTWKNSTPLEKTTNVASSLLSTVNALFSPATGVIKTAETVPVVGKVAHAVNSIFSALGAAGGTTATTVVDKLPISQKTKDTINPLVNELGALVAQIGAGKLASSHPMVKAKMAEITKQIVDHVENDATTPVNGLQKLVQQAQKPEVSTSKVETPVEVPTIASEMNKLPQGDKKVEATKALDKSLGKENEFINGNSFQERQTLLNDVIKPQLEKLGPVGKDETIVYHNAPDRTLKSDNYVSTDPEQMWMYADKNTIVQKVKNSELQSSGFPEKDAFGERLYKKSPEGVARPLTPAESMGETVSGVAKNIESKAVEKKLTEGYEEDVAKYSATTFKEQSERATKLVNDDVEQARRIVRGEESLPDGMREAPLVAAMEEYAVRNPEKAGNIYHELAKSNLASEVSLSGQGLSLARLRDTNSPTYVLKDVQKAREERVQKKLGNKTIKQAKKETVNNIKMEIKKNAPKREDWDTFIKNLTCGIE